MKPGQRSVVANIVEGESRDPEACTAIGKCTVRNLPKDLPAGTPIEVRFRYEENGRLRISVHVAGVDSHAKHEITRDHNVTRADLDAWRAKVNGTPAF
jgi:molecular chaperone DnaK